MSLILFCSEYDNICDIISSEISSTDSFIATFIDSQWFNNFLCISSCLIFNLLVFGLVEAITGYF